MSCQLHALLWMLIGPSVMIGIYLRLVYMANRHRFTQEVANRRKINFLSEADDSKSINSEYHPVETKIKFLSVLTHAMGLEYKLQNSSDVKSISNASTPPPFSNLSDIRLRTFSAGSKTGVLLALFFLWTAPNLILLCIYFASFNVYHFPCIGCDVSFELLIFMNIATPAPFFAEYKVRKVLQNAPDPDEVLKEVALVQKTGFSLLMIACWFLLGFDPNFHDYDNQVSYEWFNIFGLFIVWIVFVPYQLILTMKDRNRRLALQDETESRTSSQKKEISNETLFNIIKDPESGPDFESFCEQQMVLESIRFLQDTIEYKKYFNEKAENWRRKKAQTIMETYILPNAPLQINISSIERDKVEKAFRLSVIPEDIFEPAIYSIAVMIRQGPLSQYLLRKQVCDSIAVTTAV